MYITIRAGYTMTIKEIRQHKNNTIRQQIFTYLIHVRKEISFIDTRFFTVSFEETNYMNEYPIRSEIRPMNYLFCTIALLKFLDSATTSLSKVRLALAQNMQPTILIFDWIEH